MIANIYAKATINVNKLNEDIQAFPQVYPITDDMNLTYKGVSRLVMLDRYSFKDLSKSTLSIGDLVVLTVKPDPQYPTRGTGFVTQINYSQHTASILIDE